MSSTFFDMVYFAYHSPNRPEGVVETLSTQVYFRSSNTQWTFAIHSALDCPSARWELQVSSSTISHTRMPVHMFNILDDSKLSWPSNRTRLCAECERDVIHIETQNRVFILEKQSGFFTTSTRAQQKSGRVYQFVQRLICGQGLWIANCRSAPLSTQCSVCACCYVLRYNRNACCTLWHCVWLCVCAVTGVLINLFGTYNSHTTLKA